MFIEAFWKHRESADRGRPILADRTLQADRLCQPLLRTNVAAPGWRTDRGRMYIILGEPTSVVTYDTKADVYPTRSGSTRTRSGWPAGRLQSGLFQTGVGDYKLYSPAKTARRPDDSYFGDAVDYAKAYQTSNRFRPNCRVSMSLIPAKTRLPWGGRPCPPTSCSKKSRSRPPPGRRNVCPEIPGVQGYRRRGILGELLDSDVLFMVLKDPGGLTFVHYAVEPAGCPLRRWGTSTSRSEDQRQRHRTGGG